MDVCRVERTALYNKLAIISGSAGESKYAILDLFGPGFDIYLAGAAAYIIACVAIKAVRANFNNCTAEIPFNVSGTLRFADPYTWTLTSMPTIVPCSAVTPV
jgi:hypothetical protein